MRVVPRSGGIAGMFSFSHSEDGPMAPSGWGWEKAESSPCLQLRKIYKD